MRVQIVRPLLASCACLAAALMVGCGGGGSGAPAGPVVPTPTPSAAATAVPIVPGSAVSATGPQGVTFSFSFGNGVPAGETVLVAPHALPTPPPTTRAGAPFPLPADELSIVVGPSPLPLSAIASLAFNGPSLTAFPYSVGLIDQTPPQTWTQFNTTRAGGPLVFANSGANAPVTTLQPGREYLLQLWPGRAEVYPPGTFPFGPNPNGTVGEFDNATSTGLYLQITAQLPADEWYTSHAGPPPGFGTLVNTYLFGFTMTIGPAAIPATFAGVVFVPGAGTPAAAAYRAEIVDITSSTYGSALSLGYVIGWPFLPAGTAPTYQPSPAVTGAPLTQVTPGDTYWVSIYRN
jgi:hypothetical protein